LVSSFRGIPLRQAKNFHKTNRKEEKENKPHSKQVENDRQACPGTTRISDEVNGAQKNILHRRFEKFVQAVGRLHKLEGNADQEELLQLLCGERRGTETNDQSRHEATSRGGDVKYIPAVCPETIPAETVKANRNVHDIDSSDN
jgi:hypothetical protein